MTEEWVLALVGSPWVFLALFALVTIDGFFPPVPSESVVIALSVLAVAGGEPNLWLVMAVAAAGAFAGDQIAYTIGRRVPVHQMRMMQGRRAAQTAAWAERALSERGAAFILGARYIPIGRVAVNMTAGSVGYSRGRFTLLAGLGAVSWAIYSVALGLGAGVWLGENKILAVGVGVVTGFTLGFLIDTVLKVAMRRRARHGGIAAAVAAGEAPMVPLRDEPAAGEGCDTRRPVEPEPRLAPMDLPGPRLVQSRAEAACAETG